MQKTAKVLLIIFLVVVFLTAVGAGSWFLFKNDRASAAENELKAGDEFLKQDNFSQALLSYKKAALLTPRSFAPYFKQGILAQKTGHSNEAIDFFLRAKSLAPQEISIYLALAEAYLSKNDVGNGRQILLEAQKLKSQNDFFSFELARLELKENNLETAQKYLEEAKKIKNDPKYTLFSALIEGLNDPAASLETINSLPESSRLGEMTLADFKKIFQKIKQMENTSSREALLYQTFNQIGETEFAVLGLKKILNDNPKMHDGWVFLSYGLLKQGELDEAKKSLDQAVAIDPISGFSHYLLAKYYEAKDNSSMAEIEFKKAQEFGYEIISKN